MITRATLLGLTAMAVAVTTTATLVVRSCAAGRWQEMQAWAQRAEQQWQARDFTRPPAYGEPQSGSAFAAYHEAASLAATWPEGNQEELTRLRHRPHEVADGEARALLARWQPAIDAMRRGARCSDARRPTDWSLGFNVPVANLLVTRDITNVAVLLARRAQDDGRAGDAVALTLDAATYGADHVHSPLLIERMIGLALVAIATDAAWHDNHLRALPAAALRTLAEGLARIDARLTAAPGCLEGEVLLLANARLPDDNYLSAALGSGLGSWRYGFSMRAMHADAVLQQAAACERLRATATAPWPERQAAVRRAGAELLAVGNPILDMGIPMHSAERTLRDTTTLVRLLRLAVAHHLGDELPKLDDPLGDGPLRREQDDDGIRFVSAATRGERQRQRAATPRQ